MKKQVLVYISAISFCVANAQSELIKNVFRLLPADKVYDLTPATRDSMLNGKTFYPADNDDDQIVAYNYGISTNVKDYLYVSMSFENGQRATGLIEIRSFQMTDGNELIIVSRSGGVWQVAYGQHELSGFLFNKARRLVPYNKKIFPATDETIFMKPGIPDTIKNIILKNSNMAFNFSDEKVRLSLNSFYVTDNQNLRQWLKGDVVYFDWIKDRFMVSKTEFQ